MNRRLLLIRQERKILQLRAQYQRLELAEAAQPWYRTLKIADMALDGIMYLRRNPFVIGTLVFMMVLKPKGRLGAWLGRIISIYEIYQSAKNAGRRPR